MSSSVVVATVVGASTVVAGAGLCCDRSWWSNTNRSLRTAFRYWLGSANAELHLGQQLQQDKCPAHFQHHSRPSCHRCRHRRGCHMQSTKYSAHLVPIVHQGHRHPIACCLMVLVVGNRCGTAGPCLMTAISATMMLTKSASSLRASLLLVLLS
jgi:hypothetical protein